MTGQAGLLELSAGSALLLGGREWTVAAVEPQYGRVLLRAGGEERRRSIAPRPIEAIMPPSLRKPWTQWTSAWKLMDPGHPGPHYTSLKAELGTIATSLARTIDNRC